MQEHQSQMMFGGDGWRARMVYRMIPWLLRTGLLQWLNRKEYRLMSEGVVPVRLTV